MRRVTACFSLLVVGLIVQSAPAQQNRATSVQLPTFSFFSTSTTVSVPDRGSVFMGGVNRARSGSRQFGAPLLPFGNRAMGSSRGAMGTRVSVWIHDFEAIDEALLSQPTASGGYRNGLLPRTSDSWQRRLAESQDSSGRQPAPSLEDIRQNRLAAQQTRANEALVFFERAKKAEEAGKANVARIYYQMVARRDAGELKEKALARLEAIRGNKASVAAR